MFLLISFFKRSEDFHFHGAVEVYVTCREPTDKLYLHVKKLDIDNSTIMFRAVDDNHTPPGILLVKLKIS